MPYDPLTLPPGQRRNLDLLLAALSTVEPSPEEYRTLEWLAGCEVSTVANVAALLRRAVTRCEARLIVADGLVAGYREPLG